MNFYNLKKALVTIVVAGSVFPICVHAQNLSVEQVRAVISPFYAALNVAPGQNAEALVMQSTDEGWLSCNGNDECKPRELVAKNIAGFGKAIPDLKWEIKDVIVKGNQVVVRSEASGTPASDFMGVPHAGKSFKIMTIDIHTVENGKLVGKTYHLEDWMGAIRQLRITDK